MISDTKVQPIGEQLWDIAEAVEQRSDFDLNTILNHVLDICIAADRPPIFDLSAHDRVKQLIAAGADESALLKLIPESVMLTGGLFSGRGKFVAQAIIDGGWGAHSLKARSLAAGWMAAYLRAVATKLGYNPLKL
ncbi:hypothetical protein [Novosphingobium sp.]|uniref:hypothetical protein n=1 Tax=Novosphingobium sp. TaxID=1874826 RepID=UPI0035B4B7B9